VGTFYMKKPSVSIVDYGLGNLLSVKRALIAAGADEVVITDDARVIHQSDRIVLPGVGAFADGISGLQIKGLDEAITRFADTGRPVLGVCLGMQLLAHTSLEFGTHSGLALIPGIVRPIKSILAPQSRLKSPFVGWSTLCVPTGAVWANTPLADVKLNESVYFVHSFFFDSNSNSNTLATYQYGGFEVTAAVQRENIFGVQFHPEKSGSTGLKILSSFMKI
jgi:glutamine amidotransferase